MKNIVIAFAILLTALSLNGTAFADVKVKIRQTIGGQTLENTTYIKGKRQRDERNFGALQTVSITQCDLKRTIQLAPQTQLYTVDAWNDHAAAATTTTTNRKNTAQTVTTKGGVVTMIQTIKDTGERKQMFGYTARHLLITMEMKSSPNACSPVNNKMQTDGWYIDAAFALDCDAPPAGAARSSGGNGGCQDRYETKSIGAGKRGYPVYEKTVMLDESGKEISQVVSEVTELSDVALDVALFDVPAGYREVKDQAALYTSMSSRAPANNGDDSANSANNSALNQSVKKLANQTAPTASPAANELAAKKPGVARIGLAVTSGKVGEDMNANELAAAVQNALSERLKSQTVEVVALAADSPEAVDQAAKAKACDFVVYANVAHKKGGGFGKMFNSIAPIVTSVVPMAGVAGVIIGAVASTAVSTATATAKVKNKDEITLDIKLHKNASALLAQQFKAKAKSGGEDILTTLVEQAAAAITSQVAGN